MLVWLITVFNSYLVSFLVNTFEQVFYSNIAVSIGAVFSRAFGGYIYAKLGASHSLCLSYSIAAMSGFICFFYGLAHQDELIFLVLILLMRFGTGCAFNITYLAHK